jgi:hypothetical protein
MPRRTFPRLVPVLLALSVGLAACGGSDEPEQVDATVSQPRTTATQRRPATVTTPPTTTTPPVTTTTQPPVTTQTTPPPATTTQPADSGGASPTTPQGDGGATLPSEPPSTTPSQPDDGAVTTAACGNVAGGFITGVQASGADCGEASGVASAWLDAIGESGPDADVSAGGYACSGALNGTKAAVTCIADGGRRVTFEASP